MLLRQLWRPNEAMHHLCLTPAPANAAAILHASAQALCFRKPAFGIMETLVFCCEGYASASGSRRSVVGLYRAIHRPDDGLRRASLGAH